MELLEHDAEPARAKARELAPRESAPRSGPSSARCRAWDVEPGEQRRAASTCRCPTRRRSRRSPRRATRGRRRAAPRAAGRRRERACGRRRASGSTGASAVCSSSGSSAASTLRATSSLPRAFGWMPSGRFSSGRAATPSSRNGISATSCCAASAGNSASNAAVYSGRSSAGASCRRAGRARPPAARASIAVEVRAAVAATSTPRRPSLPPSAITHVRLGAQLPAQARRRARRGRAADAGVHHAHRGGRPRAGAARQARAGLLRRDPVALGERVAEADQTRSSASGSSPGVPTQNRQQRRRERPAVICCCGAASGRGTRTRWCHRRSSVTRWRPRRRGDSLHRRARSFEHRLELRHQHLAADRALRAPADPGDLVRRRAVRVNHHGPHPRGGSPPRPAPRCSPCSRRTAAPGDPSLAVGYQHTWVSARVGTPSASKCAQRNDSSVPGWRASGYETSTLVGRGRVLLELLRGSRLRCAARRRASAALPAGARRARFRPVPRAVGGSRSSSARRTCASDDGRRSSAAELPEGRDLLCGKVEVASRIGAQVGPRSRARVRLEA